MSLVFVCFSFPLPCFVMSANFATRELRCRARARAGRGPRGPGTSTSSVPTLHLVFCLACAYLNKVYERVPLDHLPAAALNNSRSVPKAASVAMPRAGPAGAPASLGTSPGPGSSTPYRSAGSRSAHT